MAHYLLFQDQSLGLQTTKMIHDEAHVTITALEDSELVLVDAA